MHMSYLDLASLTGPGGVAPQRPAQRPRRHDVSNVVIRRGKLGE